MQNTFHLAHNYYQLTERYIIFLIIHQTALALESYPAAHKPYSRSALTHRALSPLAHTHQMCLFLHNLRDNLFIHNAKLFTSNCDTKRLLATHTNEQRHVFSRPLYYSMLTYSRPTGRVIRSDTCLMPLAHQTPHIV